MKVVLVGLLFLCIVATHSEAATIKLCGREFVRAVAFACGASRWRRQLGDPFSEGFIDGNGDYMENSKSQSNELIQYYVESEKDLQDMQQKSVHKRNYDDVQLAIICCTIGCSADTIHSLC